MIGWGGFASKFKSVTAVFGGTRYSDVIILEELSEKSTLKKFIGYFLPNLNISNGSDGI